jgi:hypothetical protein
MAACSWPACDKPGGKCHGKPFSELACLKGGGAQWLAPGLLASKEPDVVPILTQTDRSVLKTTMMTSN